MSANSSDRIHPRLKPLFLITPKAMSAKDIRRAEKLAGICVVECTDPDEARFCEPPLNAELDVQARAALSLMRHILSFGDRNFQTNFSRGYLTQWFTDALMNSPRPATVQGVKR